MARTDNAGVSMALMVQGQMATPIINEAGTEEQKREFLAPALAGEKIEETNIARAWRDVRLLSIGGGISEVMKEIIAQTSGM